MFSICDMPFYSQGLLNRDPLQRLGARSKDEIRRQPFFAPIDWVALYRREIAPPYNPCKAQRQEDAKNFEPEFTAMPVRSIDESAGSGNGNGRGRVEDEVKANPKDVFTNFTYEGDSYLLSGDHGLDRESHPGDEEGSSRISSVYK